MSGLDQGRLTVTHRLQKLLVILLLLDNRLLCTQVLSLLPNLLFQNVVLSKLAQFLLQHQLVVLRPHVILHLLFTALELDHDLTIALLDGLTVVALT